MLLYYVTGLLYVGGALAADPGFPLGVLEELDSTAEVADKPPFSPLIKSLIVLIVALLFALLWPIFLLADITGGL